MLQEQSAEISALCLGGRILIGLREHPPLSGVSEHCHTDDILNRVGIITQVLIPLTAEKNLKMAKSQTRRGAYTVSL